MSFIKKNGFSKVAALVLSATMVFGSTVTAFAEDPEPETQSGSGNILAYVNETYVVPTSLKVALNPGKLHVNVRYVKTEDTSLDASKTYYTYDSAHSKYVYVADPDGGDIGTYYEAETNDEQIVSFNYGIVNESTKDKKVKITLEVTGNNANTDETKYSDIVFVDSAADATAKTSPTAETGAGFGELKMYLAIAPSTAAPTANTYVKNTAAYDSNKTYYTWDDSNKVYNEATITTDFEDDTDYYLPTNTIGTRIQKSELVDVAMDPVAAEKQTGFAAGTTAGTASAEIGYKLGKATYSPKKGEIIDWSTTQAQLADKVELSAIGGTAAFTITGTMNANADWTKAKATVLTIAPTYEVKDADGTETVLENAGFNQMQLATAEQLSAAAFKTTHATILAKTTEDVTADDLTAINTALDAYDALSAEVKALLTTEKALLESLKTAAEALAITDEVATLIFSGNKFYLGSSSSAGLIDTAFTMDDVVVATLQENDSDAVDISSKAFVESDNGYWVGISFSDAATLGVRDTTGTYTMVVQIGNVRYTGSLDF